MRIEIKQDLQSCSDCTNSDNVFTPTYIEVTENGGVHGRDGRYCVPCLLREIGSMIMKMNWMPV